MSLFVHSSWNGLRRSRVLQVLIVTFLSLTGGIALIATSSGDANARNIVALASCSPTWNLTGSLSGTIAWTNTAVWCGPVIGEYPGQTSTNQSGTQTVNLSGSGLTINFDAASVALPINLNMGGAFGDTLNVNNPMTLQGSSSLGSSGNVINVNSSLVNTGTVSALGSGSINVNSGGTLTNNAGAAVNSVALTLNNGGAINNIGTITNAGVTSVLAGGTLSGAGTFTNSGTLNMTGPVVIDAQQITNTNVIGMSSATNVTLQNGAAIANNSPGTINITGGGGFVTGAGAAGSITNGATFVTNGLTGPAVPISVNFNNNGGAVSTNSRGLTFSGTNNLNGGTLTSGSGQLTVGGATTIPLSTFPVAGPAPMVVQGSSPIILAGTVSLIGNINGGTPTTIISSSAALTGNSTGTAQIIPAFTNAGGTVQAASGVLSFAGGYTQSSGNTIAGPGTLDSGTAFMSFNGGTLTGSGPITSSSLSNNGGSINPNSGAGAGTIALTGSYGQGAGGSLTTDIFSATSYDQFTVSGAANLAGTYTATLQGGYAPANGTTFTPMTYASHTGVFGTYNLPTYAGGGFMTQTTGPTALQLTAVIQGDVQITKTLATPLVAGQNATYTVTVTNNGPSSAAAVTVSDTTPAGTTFVSNSGGCVTAYPCSLGTLAPSQVVTINSTYSVPASAAGSTISNTATVSSSTFDQTPGNNSATTGAVVTGSADLQVTKTLATALAAGQNVTYTVTVTNAGPSDAAGVSVSDPTPPGLTFVSNTGGCSTAYPCAIGTMLPGQTVTINSTYSVPPTATGNVTNSATASSTTPDPVAGNNTGTNTSAISVSTDLQVVKTGPASATPGNNVVYTITVTNNGPATATGVNLTDPTPAGYTFVSATGACTSFPCAIGTMNVGQVSTTQVTYSVSPAATGFVTNTATVSSTSTDPTPGNNSSSVTTTMSVNSDVAINKTLSSPLVAGQNATYTITVQNLGPSTATGVVVSDPTPAGTTFVSNSGGCTTAFPCSLGTLAPSQVVTVTSTYSVLSSATGTVTNTATVSSTSNDSNPANNSSTSSAAVAIKADVRIIKILTGSMVAGQNATYLVIVTNGGPSDATSVVVNDTPGPELSFISNTGGCTTAFPCSLGTIAAGQNVSVNSTFAVNPAATGSVSNTASVSSATPDPFPANNSSTATTPVTVSADVSVTKSGPATSVAGSTVTFNLTVSNAGPSTATGVVLDDPTPAGMTFVSASGACSAFPCNLGTMAPGSSQNVAARYQLNRSGQITNTATVTATTPDPAAGNNSASATLNAPCPTTPALLSPPNGSPSNGTSGTLRWSDVGAGSYRVFLSPAGTGCSTLVATTSATSYNYTGLTRGATYEWHVEPVGAGSCPPVASACYTFSIDPGCSLPPPTLISPAPNAVVSSPVTFNWTAVANAVSYSLFLTVNDVTTMAGVTSATSLTVPVPDGLVSWYVIADTGNCQLQSAAASFTLCNGAPAPVVKLVSEVATQQKYTLEWLDNGAAGYEVDESTNESFSGATTTAVTGTSLTFQHAVSKPTPFFYRVRGFSTCQQKFGEYSDVARVVVTTQLGSDSEPSANGQAGTNQILVLQVKIPGFPEGSFPFSATVDQPWLKVTPATGVLPPGGLTLVVTADPSTLTNGTWTGTLFVTIGSAPAASGVHALDSRTVTIPVSVNLVTPVATAPKGAPAANSLIIPSVGHLDGQDTRWQSDVRLANTTDRGAKYQLVLTPLGATSSSALKQTTVSVEPGATMALDDIIRNWFGIGSLGESSNGTLQITPVDPSGTALNALVSSRTYDVTGHGTFGQFIPAVPLSKFVGKGPSVLGLQQIAQSESFRTNLGLVEGSGQPASLLISAFDGSGKKVLDVPLDLRGGEQKQLNSFLGQYGVSLPDGRIEVKVTSGLGKVTAYASVVDRQTGDPLLVAGQPIGIVSANRYILPAVTGQTSPVASLRTDMRLFNPATSSQPATLTFYPENNGTPKTANVLINAGEVKRLDDVLQTLFGTSGNGAVHVTTPNASSIVVTGRTYNQTSAGTYGQFVPAVTVAEAVGKNAQPLNILQVEESVRYRTTIGVAEVTGNTTRVEVSVVVPGSKISPRFAFDLAPNEVRQYDVLHQLGLDNVYNVRIGVKVLEGAGKVTAYGSIVDLRTQDPTFVPAQ